MERRSDILLVEDNPADQKLTKLGLQEAASSVRVHVVGDGEEALRFLRRQGRYEASPRPDLILLDLNLPRRDGRELLAEIKGDDHLKSVPVVVLTTSCSQGDVRECYRLGANCFVTKPAELDSFFHLIRQIHDFWLSTVRLPGD